MSSVALFKTTLGLKNKTWLKICGWSNYFLSSTVVFCVVGEMFYQYYTKGNFKFNNTNSAVILLHFHVFSFISWFVGVFIAVSKECLSPRTCAIINGHLTVFLALYKYNPWIGEYQNQAHDVYKVFKYSSMLHSIAFPWFFISSIIATWVFWKMSKVEEDYECQDMFKA